jgi:hypothetical protein
VAGGAHSKIVAEAAGRIVGVRRRRAGQVGRG